MSDRSEWWDLLLFVPPAAQVIVAIGILLLVKPLAYALLWMIVAFGIVAGAAWIKAGRMSHPMAMGILVYVPAMALLLLALVAFFIVSIIAVL
jgi:hypothetical protein